MKWEFLNKKKVNLTTLLKILFKSIQEIIRNVENLHKKSLQFQLYELQASQELQLYEASV